LFAASRRVTKYTRQTLTTSFTHELNFHPYNIQAVQEAVNKNATSSAAQIYGRIRDSYTRWRRSHFPLMGSRKPAPTASDTITQTEAYSVKSDITFRDYWPVFLCGQQNRDSRNVGIIGQRFFKRWYADGCLVVSEKILNSF
jgi:hypothetical protein